MFAWIANPEAWIALLTLTALEIVLGIDNIIFITILVGRLPHKDRQLARVTGLGLAMGCRILLLFSIVWVMKLTTPLFTVMGEAISGRDIILILGGLFLLAKSTHEIHHNMEAASHSPELIKAKQGSFWSIIIQIGLIDIIFSIDSVITAVGLVKEVDIMIIAIVIAVFIMMIAAKSIGEFVDQHPTIKMLALSFLILVGVALIGEGLDFHIPKGYIYFAMAYSTIVEMLNLKIRSKFQKVHSDKQ